MEFDATFLIAVISFCVFVFIMNKIFYAPVLKIMEERKLLVDDNYTHAMSIKEETNEKENYYQGELSKVRDEARGEISKQARAIKEERSKTIAEYKSDLYNKVSLQKEELRNSAIEAKEVLKNNLLDIAKGISFKILGDTVKTDSINEINVEEES